MIVRELITRLAYSTDTTGLRQYDQQLDRVRHKAEQTAVATQGFLGGMVRGLAAPLAALAAAQGFQGFVAAADEMTAAMNRLDAAMEGDTEGAAAAFDRIYASARQTGIAVTDTAGAFMRMAPSMRKLGHDTDATVEMLDGLQKGLLAAGTSSAEAGGVLRQLGQGIMAAKLNGDELVKFMEESSPTLLNAFAGALNVGVEELKEMGSKGKLTADVVLPALMKAAKAGAAEFSRMNVTVGLASARTGVAARRFAADFDKALGITRLMARSIEALGERLDRWRGSLGAIGDVVDRLGGLERMIQVVGVGLGVLTVYILATNRALAAMAVRVALAFAPWILGAAAITGIALLLHDFVTWVSGNGTRTLFEEWFGPWDQARQRIAPAIEAVQAFGAWMETQGARAFVAFHDAMFEVAGVIVAIAQATLREWRGLVEFFTVTVPAAWDAMAAAWNRNVEGMRPQVEWLLGVFRAVFPDALRIAQGTFSSVVEFFRAGADRIAQAFSSMWDRVRPILDALRSAWEGVRGLFGGGVQGTPAPPRNAPGNNQGLGAGHYSSENPTPTPPLPEEFRQQIRGLLELGAAPGGANLAGTMTPPSRGPVDQSQQNVFNQNITVNATGVSGAEVAQGAARGVDQANGRASGTLREVQAAMPLAEAPAQ